MIKLIFGWETRAGNGDLSSGSSSSLLLVMEIKNVRILVFRSQAGRRRDRALSSLGWSLALCCHLPSHIFCHNILVKVKNTLTLCAPMSILFILFFIKIKVCKVAPQPAFSELSLDFPKTFLAFIWPAHERWISFPCFFVVWFWNCD